MVRNAQAALAAALANLAKSFFMKARLRLRAGSIDHGTPEE